MTKKQEAFLREYLVTGDKMEAYRLAYPDVKESSIKSAVNRLLRTNPDIAKAVRAKDRKLDRQAERKVLKRKERKHVAKDRLRELIADVIEGRELTEKIYRTRDGFERQLAKPTVSQKLAAANACIRMEGWGRPPQRRTKQKQDDKKEEPEGPENLEIYIGGLPIDDYTALFGNTTRAYFDPEDGSSKWWPLDIHMDRYMEQQQRRAARKDAERQQRMTPQLELEEQQAIRSFENRPVDEEDYQPQDKLIDKLRDEYVATKNTDKLRELQAVQKMCGLRFLPHRHRYEAEREAGWEFHPLNNNLIRKSSPFRQQKETNQGRHFDQREKSPEPLHVAKPEQQPAQVQASSPEPPDHLTLLKQDYQPIKELLQDEFDYYIKNQCSTTWQQKKQLERFAAHRNAPPEVRKQIEQETGWFYHPEYTYYAKRDPKRPLVRGRFAGPPGCP